MCFSGCVFTPSVACQCSTDCRVADKRLGDTHTFCVKWQLRFHNVACAMSASPILSRLCMQTVQKQGTAQFRTGVLKLDLSAAFDRLRLELGEAASELDDLEAMAIDADVQP